MDFIQAKILYGNYICSKTRLVKVLIRESFGKKKQRAI